MATKYIKKPAPIEIQGIDPFTLEQLAIHLVNTDDKFNNNGVGIRAGIRIEDAFKAAEEKEVVALDEEPWKLLKEAAESPSKGYPALYFQGADGTVEKLYFGKRLLPFIDAIAEATDTEPAAKTEEESK